MKKITVLFILVVFGWGVQAQDFAKLVVDARAAYKAGKLEDARFAMQQMIQEIDLITGKEIIKLLPAKMGDSAAANISKDNVNVASGFYGVMIHREYGQGKMDSKTISLDIITNSPMIATINSLLSIPVIGGMGGENKIIKINGYKALVQKNSGSGDGGEDYEIQLPLNSTLITFKAPGYSMDQVVKMANTIPVSDIAKMIQ
jgi:hypothetical protein